MASCQKLTRIVNSFKYPSALRTWMTSSIYPEKIHQRYKTTFSLLYQSIMEDDFCYLIFVISHKPFPPQYLMNNFPHCLP